MHHTCIQCTVEFDSYSSRARFCSSKCHRKFVRQKQVEVVCPVCLKPRLLRAETVPGAVCKDCQTGEHSPSWKGGHKHWSPGRHGGDKDGLSWKVQRRLAWERDKFTCRHCGEKKNRKPDVHHINPWMNSQSHALDNLICLCQSCHLKEEAKVQEVWGGASLNYVSTRTRPRCTECDIPIHGTSVTTGVCKGCRVKPLAATARKWRQTGLGYAEIARNMGVSTMTAFYYVNGRK